MNDLIDRLLEHLWLNDRLSQNTLEGYRRDLSKIGQRLQHAGKDWLSAEPADLADAVYAAEESSRSQARALSALKRLYGWLLDSGQQEGYQRNHTLAGYVHLHWGRTPQAPAAFVQACRSFAS